MNYFHQCSNLVYGTTEKWILKEKQINKQDKEAKEEKPVVVLVEFRQLVKPTTKSLL